MFSINYGEIEFDHSVSCEGGRTIFAVGHERCSGRVRVFRIDDSTGRVYALDGGGNHWVELKGDQQHGILNRLVAAWLRRIPVYRSGVSYS